MKNLVIVESPTKAKTITKFLGKDYIIKFSMGHVMDLPKSKMGIDIAHNFKPQYEIVEDKKQIGRRRVQS
jgi:DNA topoisomerase I